MKKTSEENKRRKTEEHEKRIISRIKQQGPQKTSELAEVLDLSSARVRAILANMDEIEPIGNTTNRKYKLKS